MQLSVWDMEGRLGVQPAFRFPLFKALMWHAAAHYLTRLQAALETGAPLNPLPQDLEKEVRGQLPRGCTLGSPNLWLADQHRVPPPQQLSCTARARAAPALPL